MNNNNNQQHWVCHILYYKLKYLIWYLFFQLDVCDATVTRIPEQQFRNPDRIILLDRMYRMISLDRMNWVLPLTSISDSPIRSSTFNVKIIHFLSYAQIPCLEYESTQLDEEMVKIAIKFNCHTPSSALKVFRYSY